MGSSVSLPTGRTSFSVISANARAALRWRSTLSENESVVRAERGEPVKKLVVVRSVARRIENDAAEKSDTEHFFQERTLEVLEQIRDGLPLVLQQQGLI